MYVPFGSERSAFWLALGAAALIAVSVGVGALTVPMAGIDVLAAGLFLTVLCFAFLRDPRRRLELREASRAPHPDGPAPGSSHVLVVAGDTLSGSSLSDEITLEAGAARLSILAPVRCSRWHYLMSDFDRELDEARARLGASLAWARKHGFDADGEVTDPDPLQTIAQKLEDFGPQAVIFVRHAGDHATWLDDRQLWRLRTELDIPVTELSSEEPVAA
jgi:hypothetical protein